MRRPCRVLDEAVGDLVIDPEIVRLDPRSLDEVIDDIEHLRAAIGKSQPARSLAIELCERVRWVEATLKNADSHPRVLFLDWMDPVIVTGHWVPDVVERAGGQYGVVDGGDTSREAERHRIRKYDPEYVFIVPCGYSIADTEDHIHELTVREGWDGLAAVRGHGTYLIEGCGYINCRGPNLVDSVELLVSLFHSDTDFIPSEMRDVYRPVYEPQAVSEL